MFLLFAPVKVVILHQHFKSPLRGGAIRSYYLAKALIDRGMAVTVITTHNEKRHTQENLEGIEVHYLPVAYENHFRFFARGRAFMQFVFGIIRRPSLLRGADLCYAISTPLTIGLAALWIKKRLNIPFIFEVGDLWPDAPIQLGFVKGPILRRLLCLLERKIYREAEAVVALSVSIEKALQNRVANKAIHVVPNMSDTTFYQPQKRQPVLEEKFAATGKFIVSYIGAIGYANGLEYFLECARASQKAALPIHFLLCGEGAMLDGLKSSAKRLMLGNISFLGFQNRECVREVLQVTDASFICYKPFEILETGSPNKYFDALAAGKLILVNFAGWIKQEIEQQSCGLYLDPKHPTDFVRKIERFLSDRDLLEKYQASSRMLAEQKYSRMKLSDRFFEVVSRHALGRKSYD